VVVQFWLRLGDLAVELSFFGGSKVEALVVLWDVLIATSRNSLN
jgi:hypothetical protein